MERKTDPRFLMLILAVMGYIESQEQPKNPFVKGFGRVQNNQQAYEYLVDAVNDCKEFYPEVEQMVENLIVSEVE